MGNDSPESRIAKLEAKQDIFNALQQEMNKKQEQNNQTQLKLVQVQEQQHSDSKSIERMYEQMNRMLDLIGESSKHIKEEAEKRQILEKSVNKRFHTQSGFAMAVSAIGSVFVLAVGTVLFFVIEKSLEYQERFHILESLARANGWFK